MDVAMTALRTAAAVSNLVAGTGSTSAFEQIRGVPTVGDTTDYVENKHPFNQPIRGAGRDNTLARMSKQWKANHRSGSWSFKGLGAPFKYGYYSLQRYSFTDTSVYHAMPCYLFELTSTHNFCNGSVAYSNPGYRLFLNETNNQVEWHPVQALGVNGQRVPTTNTSLNTPNASNTSGVSSVWQLLDYSEQTNSVLPKEIFPGSSAFIDTIDIDFTAHTARGVPQTWMMDVVKFSDPTLMPFNVNDSSVFSINSCQGERSYHDEFWSSFMSTWCQHPMLRQSGTRTAGAKRNLRPWYSILPKGAVVFRSDPKDTSTTDPSGPLNFNRTIRERFKLKVNKLVSYAGDRQNVYGGQYAAPPAANTVNTFQDEAQTFTESQKVRADPKDSIWLMVMCSDYSEYAYTVGVNTTAPVSQANTAITGNQWATKINDGDITNVNVNDSGSFDLHVLKRVTMLKTGAT